MSNKMKFGLSPATPEINRESCEKCGRCAEVCGGEPLLFSDGEVKMNPEPIIGCLGCGHCMMVCPSESISVRGRDISRDDVLPLPSPVLRATPDQLEALLISRRSIRKFDQKEVSPLDVDRILHIASTAPIGITPSQVGIIVFNGREKLRAFTKDMVETMGKMIKKWLNPVFLAIMRPFMKRGVFESYRDFLIPYGKEMCEHLPQGQDMLHYDAPLAFLFHYSPVLADSADCDIVTTYAMIAAESLGLGSCMIGMDAPFLQYNKRLMKKYGIPEGNMPGLVLIVGYPAISFEHGIRRRFASVKFFGE